MNEKTHTLDFTKVYEGWAGTFIKRDIPESALVDLETQIKAIREQAEAEQPKAWDFGMSAGGLRIHGWDTWSRGSNPMVSKSGVKDSDVHILGNLRDIVLDQGPIVIGMTEEEAAGYISGARPPGIFDRVCDALTRYRKGKP